MHTTEYISPSPLNTSSMPLQSVHVRSGSMHSPNPLSWVYHLSAYLFQIHRGPENCSDPEHLTHQQTCLELYCSSLGIICDTMGQRKEEKRERTWNYLAHTTEYLSANFAEIKALLLTDLMSFAWLIVMLWELSNNHFELKICEICHPEPSWLSHTSWLEKCFTWLVWLATFSPNSGVILW